MSNPPASDVFLGFYPLVNDFRDADAPMAPEPRYPLSVRHDRSSDIVSLGQVPDPRLLFPPDYPYTSGATPSNLADFSDLAADCGRLADLGGGDLAVDVGCNDGSLLKALAGAGARVHGVEPTDTADIAEAAGFSVTRAFLDRAVAASLRTTLGSVRAVTATNLLAHVPDFAEVAGGCRDLMADDGILAAEVQYLWSLIETTGIDSIHHEHSRYYGLKGLRHHLAEQGLEVFRAAVVPSHGGSLRVFAARPGTRAVEESVADLLAAEDARGPLTDNLADFFRRALAMRLKLGALLLEHVAAGRRVAALGAAPRGAALIHYAGLDRGLIEAVLEVPGSLKIGKRMPGTAIPVVEESRLYTDPPDVLLFLSWHLADALAPKLRARGFAGTMIVPLPEPRVLKVP